MTDRITEEQFRRAREVLDGAGWLFDDFVNRNMAAVLASAPHERDQREDAYLRARTAAAMKLELETTIEQYEVDQKANQAKAERTAARGADLERRRTEFLGENANG